MHTHIVSSYSVSSAAAAIAAALAAAGSPAAGEESMQVSLVDVIEEPSGGWRAVVRVSVEPLEKGEDAEENAYDPYHHHHGTEETFFAEDHDFIESNIALAHLFDHEGGYYALSHLAPERILGGEHVSLQDVIFYGEEAFHLTEKNHRIHVPGIQDVYGMRPSLGPRWGA